MKIACIVNSLEAGGAERICVGLSNIFARAGHVVTIVSLRANQDQFFQTAEPSIQLSFLNTALREASGASKPLAALRLIRSLRGEIRRLQPDIIVSHLDETNIYTLLSSLGLKRKVLCVLQMHPSCSFVQPNRRSPLLPALFSALRALTYRFATRIIALAADQVQALPKNLRARSSVIPNFFEESAEPVPEQRLPARAVMALGRLHPQKRFDLLIRSFAGAVNGAEHGGGNWSLWIFGEGPQHDQLLRLAAECGVGERVFLPGRTRSPRSHLSDASIVAISSDFEGMPVVLLEALSAGAAVLTTDYVGDPRNVVSDRASALIVPRGDAGRFSSALTELMASDELRSRLGNEALRRSERFSAKVVGQEWLRLLESI